MDNVLTNVGWVRLRYDTNPELTTCTYMGAGNGTDKIYIYLSIYQQEDRIELDASAGYDVWLGCFEQPGSIQQWLKQTKPFKNDVGDIPAMVLTPNERYFYWIFCDTYRIILVTRHSIVYESMYVGFLNPIASERQYPYPMYVCGNGHYKGSAWPNNANGSFVFPQNNQGYVRRADGVWRVFNASCPDPSPSTDGTVFPYNAHNKKLIPNYKEVDAINQDNFLLIPILLQTNNPVDMVGLLRGCYWISGTRDIDAERILVYDGEQYIVFDTKELRGPNTYFCVKMA